MMLQFSGTDAGGNTGTVTNINVTYDDNVAPTTNTVGALTPGPAVTSRVVTGYLKLNEHNINCTCTAINN